MGDPGQGRVCGCRTRKRSGSMDQSGHPRRQGEHVDCQTTAKAGNSKKEWSNGLAAGYDFLYSKERKKYWMRTAAKNLYAEYSPIYKKEKSW